MGRRELPYFYSGLIVKSWKKDLIALSNVA